MTLPKLRKDLSAPAMFGLIRKHSLKLKDTRQNRASNISLADSVMSALAMFELKFPSMLQFVQNSSKKSIKSNLGHLFQIDLVPSADYLTHLLRFTPDKLFRAVV